MNGSALARFGIGVLVACCAVPAAALADTPTLNPSGTLTFSWRGDPARGCQAAGVCDVSGSLEVIPQDQSGASETPPSQNIQIEDDNSVVRVTDPGSTPSQPHVCTQPVPVSMILIVVRPRHSRGLQAVAVPFSPPSSGDCAGPSVLSLSDLTLPARRLPGPREAYDLSGTQTIGAGPYDVTVKSTIRARRPAGTGTGSLGSSGSGSGFPFPKPFKGLIEGVSFQYQITRTSGTLTTAFAGRPDPFCLPLDACGASGMLTDAISGISGKLEFDAQRVVFRRVSRRAALADFRSGRLPLQETGGPPERRPVCKRRLGGRVGVHGSAQPAQRHGSHSGRHERWAAAAVETERRSARGSIPQRLPGACRSGRARVLGRAGARVVGDDRAGQASPPDRRLRTRPLRRRQLRRLSQRRRHSGAATVAGPCRDRGHEGVPGRTVKRLLSIAAVAAAGFAVTGARLRRGRRHERVRPSATPSTFLLGGSGSGAISRLRRSPSVSAAR